MANGIDRVAHECGTSTIPQMRPSQRMHGILVAQHIKLRQMVLDAVTLFVVVGDRNMRPENAGYPVRPPTYPKKQPFEISLLEWSTLKYLVDRKC